MSKENSLNVYVDSIPSKKKVTAVSAEFGISAYPDSHAAIGQHPLNGLPELLDAVSYLWERLQREAAEAAERPA